MLILVFIPLCVLLLHTHAIKKVLYLLWFRAVIEAYPVWFEMERAELL